MPAPQPIDTSSLLKRLKLIHIILVIGMGIFITVVLNVLTTNENPDFSWTTFSTLAGFLVGILAIAYRFLASPFKKQNAPNISIKTSLIFRYYLVCWVLLTIAILLNALLFIFIENGTSILLSIVLTGVLLYSKPHQEKIIDFLH